MNSSKTTHKKPCKKCPYKLGRVMFISSPCPDCEQKNYELGRKMIAEKKGLGKYDKRRSDCDS